LNAPPAVLTAISPASLVATDLEAVLWILLALGLSAFFSTLRAALQFSLPARVLAGARDDDERQRLAPLLERVDALATSASIYKIACDLFVVAFLILITVEDGQLDWVHLGLAVGIAAPPLLLLTEALPVSIARARGDALLVRVLPAFQVLQLPVALLGALVQSLRAAFLRILRIRDDSSSSRKIVEGLREVVQGASGELEEAERELIENVMEFGDVDAAEVMTPRTEINGVSVESDLQAAITVMADAGHSRIPVYDDNIDSIIGTVNALDVARALARPDASEGSLRDLLRPPLLVPETKLVSEILMEFRTRGQKMAIVVDEYGGTAGIVTLTDVLSEIVGEIQDEHQESEEAMRELEGGIVEVQEADFETLGGFVLAELGHFPKAGDSFQKDEVTYSVAEASDRRVLKVHVLR
jgi:CBS domain containing-hemolysin-like protein